MHLDIYMILGSALVGLLVGTTGAGGGALMTPMLILLFGVTPSSAISSDLVAAVLMRPFGAAVHLRKRTVNLRMVTWMVVGSVPMAFLGSYLLHVLGGGAPNAQTHVELALGVALLVGASAMVLRYALDRRAGHQRIATISEITVRPLPTMAIGMIGGLIVGLTSVGAGSLMIVLLLFVYPRIGANQLVGTDLTQAVPLTAAAAIGALIWNPVVFGVTASIAIGAVPAVLIGSYFSSHAPDKYIRPIITFVIFASGLKYVGVPTTALGITLGAVLVAGLAFWLVRAQPWHRRQAAPAGAVPAGAAAPPAGAHVPDSGGSVPANGAAANGAVADGSASDATSFAVSAHGVTGDGETTPNGADPAHSAPSNGAARTAEQSEKPGAEID
ncbi:MAG: sulfite exporter TauE/SafE family protein [Streptosporangiaceae bacterium]